jgi:hypothetical protein
MIYIASPYSHESVAIMQERFEQVRDFTAELIKSNVCAFSPIAHTHEMAQTNRMPTDFQFWQDYCLSMLKKADKMVVLKIFGWEQSIGVAAEIEYCHQQGIEVEYWLPGQTISCANSLMRQAG